jgi:5-methylcytosine-specific restriction endonuclease McrA
MEFEEMTIKTGPKFDRWKGFANPPGQKKAAPTYRSGQWQRLRAHLFELNGGNVCKGQWHKGDRNVAKVELDHIKEVQDAPHLEFEPSNLIFLCPQCHREKTAYAAKRRAVLAHLQ